MQILRLMSLDSNRLSDQELGKGRKWRGVLPTRETLGAACLTGVFMLVSQGGVPTASGTPMGLGALFAIAHRCKIPPSKK